MKNTSLRQWRILPLLLIITLIISGCAANQYNIAPTNTSYLPQNDKALVIFMRSSFYGSAIPSPLFDISGDKNDLIAIIGSGDKVAYYTDPGKKQFMVTGESADFMDAKLEAGKVYYAIVTPRMGVMSARFSLHPFKKSPSEPEFSLDSPQLSQWLQKCDYVEPNQASYDWLEKNAENIAKKRDSYIQKWNVMLEEDKKWRRLLPEDGLNGVL